MNTQITEDYISFETAKLLKEKGFDEPLYSYYKDGIFTITDLLCKYEFDVDLCRWRYNEYVAPTLQMAMKWLREIHNKNIILDMVPLDEDCYVLWTFNVYCNKNYKIMWGTQQPKYNTYEEACEAAIKYCLTNLI